MHHSAKLDGHRYHSVSLGDVDEPDATASPAPLGNVVYSDQYCHATCGDYQRLLIYACLHVCHIGNCGSIQVPPGLYTLATTISYRVLVG